MTTRDEAYLAWVRRQPSCISGQMDHYGDGDYRCEAHHLIGHGRLSSCKVSDYMTMPLTKAEHGQLHHIGWQKWEELYGPQAVFALRTLVKAIEGGYFDAGAVSSGRRPPRPSPARAKQQAKTKIDLATGRRVPRTSPTAAPTKQVPRSIA